MLSFRFRSSLFLVLLTYILPVVQKQLILGRPSGAFSNVRSAITLSPPASRPGDTRSFHNQLEVDAWLSFANCGLWTAVLGLHCPMGGRMSPCFTVTVKAEGPCTSESVW